MPVISNWRGCFPILLSKLVVGKLTCFVCFLYERCKKKRIQDWITKHIFGIGITNPRFHERIWLTNSNHSEKKWFESRIRIQNCQVWIFKGSSPARFCVYLTVCLFGLFPSYWNLLTKLTLSIVSKNVYHQMIKRRPVVEIANKCNATHTYCSSHYPISMVSVLGKAKWKLSIKLSIYEKWRKKGCFRTVDYWQCTQEKVRIFYPLDTRRFFSLPHRHAKWRSPNRCGSKILAIKNDWNKYPEEFFTRGPKARAIQYSG